MHHPVVLGSRSPRRKDLLRLLLPTCDFAVRPPTSSDEPGFDGLTMRAAIDARLQEIARLKCDDVCRNIPTASNDANDSPTLVICADTVVVAGEDDDLRALGQPPVNDSWRDVVRGWFREFYFGRAHHVVTALCVRAFNGNRVETVVRTRVEFRADGEKLLDWYLDTGEPRGKAGGYAIQELGSVFVSRIEGSLSNVAGLPLEALREIFGDAGVLP